MSLLVSDPVDLYLPSPLIRWLVERLFCFFFLKESALSFFWILCIVLWASICFMLSLILVLFSYYSWDCLVGLAPSNEQTANFFSAFLIF